MPPPRASRPLIAVLAITLAFLLLAAGHRHQTGRWIPEKDSVYDTGKGLYDADDFADAGEFRDALEKFTHQPTGLSLYEPKAPYNYMWTNEAKILQLAVCMAKGTCHPNAVKFIVIGAYHCHLAVYDGYRGGEGIWCMNMIDSLEKQGYTVLLAGEADWKYMAHLHRQFPDNIKVVLADDGSIEGIDRGHKQELKSKDNPHGIPAWKFFRFSYFPNGLSTIVGQAWSAIAEPEWRKPGEANWRNMTYLGYALDDENPPIVPFSERPMRAYILAKRIQYFYEFFGKPMIGRDQITKAYHELRKEFPTFEFVGGFIDDRSQEEKDKQGPMTLPEGVRNLGKLNPSEWDREIGNSRAMVGIGWPPSSPSPYYSLARGVPFINPHRVDEGHDPKDPTTWSIAQHEFLRIHNPPEVYQYPEYDYEAFVNAIRQSITNEMKPHLLERLTRKALDERMRNWVEADWRHAASVILENRKNGGKETEFGPDTGIFEL